MAHIAVVGFEFKNAEQDAQIPRPVKVTREKLATMEGAVEIGGTEERVEESELDPQGFYHPRP